MRKSRKDPLNPRRLNHRMNLFEIACLPSMINQTDQDFTWILIIDKDLPHRFRKRLDGIIKDCKNINLYTYDSSDDLSRTDFFAPYIKPDTEYVITTKLDDDDALYDGFVAYNKRYLSEIYKKGTLYPLHLIGTQHVINWDFFSSENAKLGYKKARSSKHFPPASGFTVCCKYPELNFTIIRFGHGKFHFYAFDNNNFENHVPSFVNAILKVRSEIHENVANSGLPWDGKIKATSDLHIIPIENHQTLLINHFDIIQYTRLINTTETRVPVEPGTFRGFHINYDLAEEYILKFRKSPKTFIRFIIQNMKFRPDYTSSFSKVDRISEKLSIIRNTIRGVKKLK